MVEDTLIDPVSVVKLIAELLPGPSPATSGSGTARCRDTSDDTQQTNNEVVNTAISGEEEAGCILWDLSALPAAAALMMDNYLLEIIPSVMQLGSDRMVEICAGILGNMACHPALLPRMQTPPLIQCIIANGLWRNDSACLIEILRFFATVTAADGAGEMTKVLLTHDALGRIAWIMENTLSSPLLARCCEVVVNLAQSTNTAKDVLYQQPFLEIASTNLHQHAVLPSEETREPSEWDEPESLPAAETLESTFSLLEGLSDDSEWARAIKSDEQLRQVLFLLMRSNVDIRVVGRTAALLASLDDKPMYKLAAQDAGVMGGLLKLLLEGTFQDDYAEGGWALLGSLAVAMREAGGDSQVQKGMFSVLGIIVDSAGSIARAGLDVTESMLMCRAAYALNQLSAALEHYKVAQSEAPFGHPTETQVDVGRDFPRIDQSIHESDISKVAEASAALRNAAMQIVDKCS